MGKGGNPGRNGAKDRQMAKRTRALELRDAGWTLDAIAASEWPEGSGKRLYGHRQAARRAILQALEAHESETVREYRALNTRRLERLLRACWEAALTPNLDAIREARMLIADLSKLQGANMPTRLELTDDMDREIEELVAALQVDDDTWDITGVPPDNAMENDTAVSHTDITDGGTR